MAAISALADYGSENSSNSEAESDANCEESCLHLKPLDQGKTLSLLQTESRVIAAPIVATKVSSSSSSSDTVQPVQGSVILPHYRTLVWSTLESAIPTHQLCFPTQFPAFLAKFQRADLLFLLRWLHFATILSQSGHAMVSCFIVCER